MIFQNFILSNNSILCASKQGFLQVFLVCFRSLIYKLSRNCSIISVSRFCNLLITSSTVICSVPNPHLTVLVIWFLKKANRYHPSLFKVNAVMIFFPSSFPLNRIFYPSFFCEPLKNYYRRNTSSCHLSYHNALPGLRCGGQAQLWPIELPQEVLV